MKNLVFYIGVSTFAFLISARTANAMAQASQRENDYENCLAENGMTRAYLFTDEEMVNKTYEQPGNEEKKRKNGCFFECMVRKSGVMEGSEIDEAKMNSNLSKGFDKNPTRYKLIKIVNKCIPKVKDKEECEKGFSLLLCMTESMKAMQNDEEE